MTDKVNNSSLLDDLYWKPEESAKAASKDDARLGQEDFFKLLTQQLSMQDPTKPVENDQMIAQMTNFTMAEGITGLSEQFEKFSASMTSNQALQASSLIGRQVLIPSDTGYFNGSKPVEGMVALDQSAQNVTLRVENESGQVVRTVDMGTLPPGQHKFSWDGLGADGEPLPAGDYKITANGRVGGANEDLVALTYANVESVSTGGQRGIVLNLESIGRIDFKDVIQITNGGGGSSGS
ncbi:flagellar hook assembly protein FlgD [Aliidiomarina minuta]|uniref:Basal-body rod modification protein FlgD n=1 Tax=Aliidiomarina minuta TaxID=880057 RepID=A0A432W9W0_9GAMM|nr:flagellar hook assembly protein FlgD [Aliidiomarina minuta]RUO26398.1 flagellar hook assembly protein FlgD [Aliidiomarina minuta]